MTNKNNAKPKKEYAIDSPEIKAIKEYMEKEDRAYSQAEIVKFINGDENQRSYLATITALLPIYDDDKGKLHYDASLFDIKPYADLHPVKGHCRIGVCHVKKL